MLKEGDWNPKGEKWKSDWLLANLQDNSMVHVESSSWACLFGLFIWCFWKNRNLFIFQGRSWSLREIVQVSLSLVNQLFSTLRVDFKGSFKPHVEKKSFEDSIFLNTDGVVQLGFENAAAGGVFCEASGDWIFGYNRCHGKCSIFNAELWGILEGLRLIQ
ncbi:hypothetical protein Gotri_021098 [Gossypium trilobum]|uniref:RNase H type-1 domain-containing protein n=1 Tax=Gossypium trilobum TaxID=34281 RepID=A0A7J9DBI3_9ROSI|nr:hypothetical protein [Gossypium trilobum]